MQSPVGEVLLAGHQAQAGRDSMALTQVSMSGWRNASAVPGHWRLAPSAFAEVTRQLTAYFAGHQDRGVDTPAFRPGRKRRGVRVNNVGSSEFWLVERLPRLRRSQPETKALVRAIARLAGSAAGARGAVTSGYGPV